MAAGKGREALDSAGNINVGRLVNAPRSVVRLASFHAWNGYERLRAYEQRRAIFLDVADRFQKSTAPAETERLRDELANMTFGH
jgi:hypothetical protein